MFFSLTFCCILANSTDRFGRLEWVIENKGNNIVSLSLDNIGAENISRFNGGKSTERIDENAVNPLHDCVLVQLPPNIIDFLDAQ